MHKTLSLLISLLFLMPLAVLADDEEFDEAFAIIEVNATDGDVGFHAKMDGEAWSWGRITDPMGKKIANMKASNALADQGLTEFFFESSEPVCEPDEEEPDARVVTLAEFLLRFAEGEYVFRGRTIEGDKLRSSDDFTYDIPAAPDVSMTDESEMAADSVVIEWMPGDDLGENCHDQDLIDDGLIPDHADVEVVGWEVVVEPDDDEAADPERKFSAQLPPDQLSVEVPEDFFTQYLADGFSEFKFEVGAIEEGGNQTFTEGSFEVTDD
jgi:hypothetical protein